MTEILIGLGLVWVILLIGCGVLIAKKGKSYQPNPRKNAIVMPPVKRGFTSHYDGKTHRETGCREGRGQRRD